MRRPLAAAILILTAMARPGQRAFADDGEAAISAGSIEFKKSAAVALEREELYLSTGVVSVRFRFKNLSASGYRALVAFPMPAYTPFTQESCEAGLNTRCDWAQRVGTLASGFAVRVGGREQPFRKESKILAKGRDVTALLEKYAIPAVDGDLAGERLSKLDPAAKDELKGAGIDETLNWELRDAYYWEQDFLPGQETVIEHRYAPGLGKGFILKGEDRLLAKDYCIDEPTAKGIRALSGAGKDRGSLPFVELDYILSSAKTWVGPIGRFHVILDKPPGTVLSTCFAGLKKTGPLRFEAEFSDFVPSGEFKAAFFGP